MGEDEKTGKPDRSQAPAADQSLIVPRDSHEKSFVRGLVERGEAAHPDATGKLPPGATHEIVGETPDGLPILRRRRFSIR